MPLHYALHWGDPHHYMHVHHYLDYSPASSQRRSCLMCTEQCSPFDVRSSPTVPFPTMKAKLHLPMSVTFSKSATPFVPH